MKSWHHQAIEHAAAAYQSGAREACGLIVFNGTSVAYRACRNVAAGVDEFEISAEEFVAAEDAGEIVGVFHSHPDAPATPSAADRAACDASGLPWFILGLPNRTWAFCGPAGAPMPYTGRPFIHGAIDCYTLLRDWHRHERGIELLDFSRKDEWWKAGQNLYVENFGRAGFSEISIARSRPSDVVLMAVKSDVPNHAGILLDGNTMLHHLYDRLSEITSYSGFFRSCTTHFLRHADA